MPKRFVPNFASIGTANGGGAKRVWPSKFEAYCPDDDWADPVYEYMLRMALGTLTVRNASEYVLHSYTPLITKNLQLLASDIIYCEKIPGNWSTGKPPVPDTLQLLFRRMMSSRHQMWLKSWDPVVAESTKEQLDLCKVSHLDSFDRSPFFCRTASGAALKGTRTNNRHGPITGFWATLKNLVFSKSVPFYVTLA